MLTNVDIGTCQNLTSKNSAVVKCRGEKLSPEPDKPDIEQPPNVDQPGVITGFIIIGTQTGTHRNSLYAPAYRTITGQTTSLCHANRC